MMRRNKLLYEVMADTIGYYTTIPEGEVNSGGCISRRHIYEEEGGGGGEAGVYT